MGDMQLSREMDNIVPTLGLCEIELCKHHTPISMGLIGAGGCRTYGAFGTSSMIYINPMGTFLSVAVFAWLF